MARAVNSSAGGVGEARFLHLWKNDGGVWKLARVVSDEHHEAGH